MAESDNQEVWSRFCQANADRAPRPLFTEALAAPAPVSAAHEVLSAM